MNLENPIFYVAAEEPKDARYPLFLLKHIKWDDFGRQTLFYLDYYPSKGKLQPIGNIKIIHKIKPDTPQIIPKSFLELPEEFCSLGQDVDFYYTLKNLAGIDKFNVLSKLNDVGLNPGIFDKFQYLDNFKHSLIRYSEAEKALSESAAIIAGAEVRKQFQFSYRCSLSEGIQFPAVEFNFGNQKDLPNNLIAIIGNNGVGKTRFLAQLALDLSGQGRKFLSDGTFIPQRPLFGRVIAISYSAFDKFSRPSPDKSFSYYYCGIKSNDGRSLSENKILDKFRESFALISKAGHERLWLKSISPFLGIETADRLMTEIFDKNHFEYFQSENNNKFSSGHKYVLFAITQLIAYIRKDSLVLFDEPEMHLHPNAIYKLITVLYRILKSTHSYAIVATHSPIVLQAIPSRYVRVFSSIGGFTSVRTLYHECFGSDIDKITDDVFNAAEVQEWYTEVLNELRMKYNYEEIIALFDKKLTLNPKTYLHNLYNAESNSFEA